VIAAMLVVTLFGATAGAASRRVAPPGNAGAAQYQEDVPTAQGSQPVSSLTPSRHGGGNSGSSLPPSVSRQLNADGADGRAALSVAEQTTPPAPAQATASGAPASSSSPSRSPARTGSPAAASSGAHAAIPLSGSEARGSSAATALAGSLGGSGGGLGVALPILLATSVLAAAVAVLAQRRRRS
jgi:hypothetical protein